MTELIGNKSEAMGKHDTRSVDTDVDVARAQPPQGQAVNGLCKTRGKTCKTVASKRRKDYANQ
jgi:hypothetical protein